MSRTNKRGCHQSVSTRLEIVGVWTVTQRLKHCGEGGIRRRLVKITRSALVPPKNIIFLTPCAGKSNNPFHTTPPDFMGYRVMKQRFYALTLGTSRFLFSGIGWGSSKMGHDLCRHLVPLRQVSPLLAKLIELKG